MIHNSVVKIFTTEVRVAISRKNFKNSVSNIQNRNVECSTTKVEDGDFFVFFAVQTISKRGGGWLVDNSLHFEAGDFTRVFCSLSLTVVKVSRNGDHRFGHFFAKESFGVGFDFRKNHRRNFFWRVFFVAHFYGYTITFFHDFVRHNVEVFLNFVVSEFSADQALHTINCVFWVSYTLALRHLSDESFAFFIECNHRWSCTISFGVCDNLWFSSHHIGESRVGCTEVDSDNFSHFLPFLLKIHKQFQISAPRRLHAYINIIRF